MTISEKIRCRITIHNLPIPLDKTDFVTYSLPRPQFQKSFEMGNKSNSKSEGDCPGSLMGKRAVGFQGIEL
jgi:hypothetical protein